MKRFKKIEFKGAKTIEKGFSRCELSRNEQGNDVANFYNYRDKSLTLMFNEDYEKKVKNRRLFYTAFRSEFVAIVLQVGKKYKH